MKNTIVTQLDPKSAISEAFRNLRTNVHYTNIDNQVNLLQITSSVQGEGKSTITANYGVTLAQSGKKVLIVDCDLRRPQIHKIFNISNTNGLSNVLVGDNKMDKNIKDTKVPNLFVLTSGPIPPNPSEMLDSKRMRELILSLKDHFDMILLDSPPIMPVTDGLILSQIVDGTIVIVSLGSTERDALKKTMDSLEKIGANILGTVINKASSKAGYYVNYEYEYK
ncbi:CpsD/CapB family tyrosine-protein kinase [Alkalibacter saccharofermentans]|uniref:non-specific protein-tyrosine kinase n=1 Tax=Alkalibacter saccharofermentans DSM 14828 TaxID=1120975 RepID=A0A1M4ZUV4_9FIRM|nr:CpsD/CapB family tyrosine-protein kinase [Alkalibacter saccharofermentans]SHF21735.1 capsular exopolysaccharide family [Alkalibacter saccharofermentans DSM 14828]